MSSKGSERRDAAPAEMECIACTGDGRTRIERRPVPEVGPGEVLLRLRACGLCGTDIVKLQSGAAAPGLVLGHELVGTVVARGEGVASFAAGDRVVVPHHVACGECALCRRGSETMCAVFRENLMEPGGFSEYVLLRERGVRLAMRRVPESLADERAVFLEPAACVLRGVRRSGMVEDGTAVILGAGSMGLLYLLVIRAILPRADAILVDPLVPRRELAAELGAGRTAPPESAAEVVEDATAGLGADAVFDTVGGGALLESALGLARPGGTVVLFAHAPGGGPAALDLNGLFKSERRIAGTYSGGLAEQREAWDLLVAGELRPEVLVSARMPLAEFDEAVEQVVGRRALKVLLEAGSGERELS